MNTLQRRKRKKNPPRPLYQSQRVVRIRRSLPNQRRHYLNTHYSKATPPRVMYQRPHRNRLGPQTVVMPLTVSHHSMINLVVCLYGVLSFTFHKQNVTLSLQFKPAHGTPSPTMLPQQINPILWRLYSLAHTLDRRSRDFQLRSHCQLLPLPSLPGPPILLPNRAPRQPAVVFPHMATLQCHRPVQSPLRNQETFQVR